MAKIILYKHPLKTEKEFIDLDKECTLGSVLDKYNCKKDYAVLINGQYPEKVTRDLIINKNDLISIIPVLSGGGDDSAKVLTTIVQIAALVLVATGVGAPLGAALGASASAAAAVGNAVILVASSLLVAGIRASLGKRSLSEANGIDAQSQSPTYSLQASGNSARSYQSLQIVLGNHRIYPDYGSQPYMLYQLPSLLNDPTAFTVVNQSNPVSYDLTSPAIDQLFVARPPGEIQTGFNTYINVLPTAGNWSVLFGTNSLGGPDYNNTNFNFFDIPNSKIFSPRNFCKSTVGKVTVDMRLPLIHWNYLGQDYYFFYTAFLYWYNNAYNPLATVATNASNLVTYLNQSMTTFACAPDEYNYGSDTVKLSSFRFGFPVYELFKYRIYKEPPPQKIHHIFNFGMGDIDIEDGRFSEANISTLRNYTNVDNDYSPTIWNINEPLNLNDSFGSFNSVATRAGSNIANNEYVFSEPLSWKYPNNFVYKQSPKNTNQIIVNFEGRLFRNDTSTGNAIPYSVVIDISYRPLGSTTWLPFSTNVYYQSGTKIWLTHSNYDIFRFQLNTPNLVAGEYEFRYAKVSPDSNTTDKVDEVNVVEVKFRQAYSTAHVGENRQSLVVVSSANTNGSIGKYSAYVKNRCWVWNGTSWVYTFSENPAWWFLYVARGGFKNGNTSNMISRPGWYNGFHINNRERLFGGGLKDSQIDIEKLKAWAIFCDTNNIKFSAVIDTARNTAEVLNIIASVGRGSLTWDAGKLSVVYEDPNQPVVAIFGPHNILAGSFKITYVNESLADEIEVNFTNPDKNWNQDTVTATRPDLVGNVINKITVDLLGVKDALQAQREANLIAAKQSYQRRQVQFSLDGEGFILTRGDVIIMSHDLTQWSFSARGVKFYNETNPNFINKIDFDCDLSGSAYIVLRSPSGVLSYHQGTSIDNIFTFNTPIPIGSGPSIMDQGSTQNQYSGFADSYPEDYLAISGFTATPGKKLRIVSVKPEGDNKFSITATDEELAMYAHEFDNMAPYLPGDYVIQKLKVFNTVLLENENGSQKIAWESENAIYYTIQVKINSGPWTNLLLNGSITHYGNELNLSYSSGQQISVKITPINVGTPFESIEETISFIVK